MRRIKTQINDQHLSICLGSFGKRSWGQPLALGLSDYFVKSVLS